MSREWKEGVASNAIVHLNSDKTMTVSAEIEDGYNNALLSRELSEKLDAYEVPDKYQIYYGGELDNINTMLEQMLLLLILGFVLIYLIMVAQFQSLLSPFIIILTVPLAFTGGFFALWFSGEGLTMLSLMGFAVLMGTVVNNGIVFVDYVNQLRRGGLEKHHALVAAGKTRMRPILMTAPHHHFGHAADGIQCGYRREHGARYGARRGRWFALCHLHDALRGADHVRSAVSSCAYRSRSG